MKKTTKKTSTKTTVAKKESTVKTTKKAAVKKGIKEKEVVKKTVDKKVGAKKSLPAQEVVKKPVRKKVVVAPKAPSQMVIQEIEKPAKVESVKTEVPKKPLEPVLKEVAIERVVIQEPVRPKEVKSRVVSRRPETLAHGVGRRKTAVARVWLKLGSGKLMVNGAAYNQYFTTEAARLSVTTPFHVIGKAQHYDILANVVGGGYSAQADAVRLGFVRALLQLNEGWRAELRKAGLLTVDSRQKERKKYGQRGARRKFQFVKR